MPALRAGAASEPRARLRAEGASAMSRRGFRGGGNGSEPAAVARTAKVGSGERTERVGNLRATSIVRSNTDGRCKWPLSSLRQRASVWIDARSYARWTVEGSQSNGRADQDPQRCDRVRSASCSRNYPFAPRVPAQNLWCRSRSSLTLPKIVFQCLCPIPQGRER